MFVCANLVVYTNATELNREKIKIVNALVTCKPINLGKVLIEHIEIAACLTRLDKKLAFPGFISHYCLAIGLKNQDNDVLLPPLDKLSDKRVASMSYKERESLMIHLDFLMNHMIQAMYPVHLFFLLGLCI